MTFLQRLPSTRRVARVMSITTFPPRDKERESKSSTASTPVDEEGESQ